MFRKVSAQTHNSRNQDSVNSDVIQASLPETNQTRLENGDISEQHREITLHQTSNSERTLTASARRVVGKALETTQSEMVVSAATAGGHIGKPCTAAGSKIAEARRRTNLDRQNDAKVDGPHLLSVDDQLNRRDLFLPSENREKTQPYSVYSTNYAAGKRMISHGKSLLIIKNS
jgi:hypothetical protein